MKTENELIEVFTFRIVLIGSQYGLGHITKEKAMSEVKEFMDMIDKQKERDQRLFEILER